MVAARPKSPRTQQQAWKKLARAAGVSPTTVSLALNNHPRVAIKTRQRVAEVASRLGFVRDYGGRRLARQRFSSRVASFDHVGLVCVIEPDAALDAVGLAMMSGAEQALSKLNACLSFVRVGEAGDWAKVDRLARERMMDAWMIYGPVDDDTVSRFKSSNLPLVILGDNGCTQPVHNVNVDNAAVGRMAVEYLASLGHRRVAVYDSVRRNFPHERHTLAGFRAAVREQGLDDDELLVRNTRYADLVEWLRGTRATAVFAAGFDWAPAFVDELKKFAEFEIPKNLSVFGCEPTTTIAKIQGFTRAELDMSAVGRQAALLLQKIVSDQSTEPAVTINLAPTLVEGWSTRRLSSLTTPDQGPAF